MRMSLPIPSLSWLRVFEAAARWFRAGSELGLADSQYNLGILYARGLGVPWAGAIFSISGMKVRSVKMARSDAWFMIQAIWSGKRRGLSV